MVLVVFAQADGERAHGHVLAKRRILDRRGVQCLGIGGRDSRGKGLFVFHAKKVLKFSGSDLGRLAAGVPEAQYPCAGPVAGFDGL